MQVTNFQIDLYFFTFATLFNLKSINVTKGVTNLTKISLRMFITWSLSMSQTAAIELADTGIDVGKF